MDEILEDILDGCDICGEEHSTEDCPELYVGDAQSPVLSRARVTLPHFLTVLDHVDGTTSVVAKEAIAAKTRLGPFEAKTTTEFSYDETQFTLKVFSKDNPVVTLDASSEETCNWMCLVQAAISAATQNCMALQIGLDIFFSTTRHISAGEELCVWYAPYYAKKLHKSPVPDGFSAIMLTRRTVETVLEIVPEADDDVLMEVEEEEQEGEEEAVPEVVTTAAEEPCHLANTAEAFPDETASVVSTSEQLIHLITAPRDLHIVHKATAVGLRKCSRCKSEFETLKALALHIKEHLLEEKKVKAKEEAEEKRRKEEQGREEVEWEVSATSDVKTEAESDRPEGVSRSGRSVHRKFSVRDVLGIKKEPRETVKKRKRGKKAKGIKLLTEMDEGTLASNFKVVDANTMPPCIVRCKRLTDEVLKKYMKCEGCTDPPVDHSYVSPKKAMDRDEAGEEDLRLQEVSVEEVLELSEDLASSLPNPEESAVEVKKEGKLKKEQRAKNSKKRLASEDGIYKCDHCDKAFSTLKGLKTHERGHDFSFQCEKCQRQFMMKVSLQRHNCQQSEEFFCEFCGARFKDKNYLLRHMAGHTGEFTCEKCVRTFARKESLLSHLHLCDPDALERRGFAKFFCQLCKKAFGKAATLQNHMALHERKYVCSACGKAFSTTLSQQKHVCPGVSILKQEKKLLCDFCPKSFDSEVTLQNHMTKHIGSMSCVLCSKAYATKKEFLKHVVGCASSQESGNYKCSVCTAVLPSESEFHQHYEEHSHPYSCELCGKRFVRKSNLQLHSCRPQGPFACTICQKEFTTKFYLKSHMSVHEKKTLQCEFCQKYFAREKKLNRHFCRNPEDGTPMAMARTSDGQVRFFVSGQSLVCPVCGKSATSVSNLNVHLKRHGEKKEPCDICGKCFLTQGFVNQHKKNVHVNEKRFPCTVCEKVYKTETSLYNHTSVYHNTSSKMFQCATCPKQFVHKGNLKKHMNVHNDKKQFVCKACGKAFRQKEQLKHHELWHKHGLRCKCNMCDKAFVTEAELKRHAQSAHGGITYSCRYCDTDCHFTNTMKRHLIRHHSDIMEWQESPVAYIKTLAKQDPSVLQRLKIPDAKETLVHPKQEEDVLQDTSTDISALNQVTQLSAVDPNSSLEGLALMEEAEAYTGGPVIVAEVQGMAGGEGEAITSSQTLIIQTEGEHAGKITSEEVAEAMRSLSFSTIEGLQAGYTTEQHVILPPGGLDSDIPMEVVMGDGSVVFVPMVSEQAQVFTADGEQGTYMELQSLE